MSAKTESVDSCPLCRASGNLLYPHVRDDLYGHDGDYGEWMCPRCGLIWLSPRPVREDMREFYGHYYTHAAVADPSQSDSPPRFLGGLRDAIRTVIFCGYYGYAHLHSRHTFCSLGKVLGRIRWLRLRAANELKERIPFFTQGGLLLDIGCGGGDFLWAMRNLGWNVIGVESDSEASAVARRRGLRVYTEPFERADIPGESADHITMHHVIEHVYEPQATLDKCYRLLKPGGSVVVYTPNAESLGHKRFRRHWRALEPPRHLFCFSAANMRALLERCGFDCIRLWTSSRLAAGMYDVSVLLQQGLGTKAQTAFPQRGRRWFAALERGLCTIGLSMGEEIVATARRPLSPLGAHMEPTGNFRKSMGH